VTSWFRSSGWEPSRAEGVRKTLAERVVTDYVLALRSRDGRQTLVRLRASVFKDTAGLVRGVFAAARDITDRKRWKRRCAKSRITPTG
jgi:PAS domain S-box-containing protein